MDLDAETIIAGHPAADWRILVIEDSTTFQVLLRSVLESSGFQLRIAGEGRQGLTELVEWKPDLVLLDLGLPDLDGMEVCEQIRAMSDAFVIMLTGRVDDESRLSGLRIGADSYVPKPFDNRELLLNIEVLLRRSKPRGGLADVITFGALTIDRPEQQVSVDGELVHLTNIERQLLERLATGEIVSRADLMTCLWGPNWFGDDHVVSVHLANLRKKVDPEGLGRIETVRGVGYRLHHR